MVEFSHIVTLVSTFFVCIYAFVFVFVFVLPHIVTLASTSDKTFFLCFEVNASEWNQISVKLTIVKLLSNMLRNTSVETRQ